MSQADKAEVQASTTWFSRSKTRAPKFSIDLVERKRLLLALDAALDKPISCIVAPAGFGKSTLLSQWRESLIARDIACAWINLDENDSEIRKFFAYLVFAIEDAGVSLGYLKKAAESGFVDMSSAAITTSLLSAIIDVEDHMVLVLDDYHRATSQEIDQFVKVLSDQCGDKIHIAIGSRTPVNINLPTLLAAGQAIEIPSASLRFSDPEVEEAMGGDLDQDALTALQQQVEGWPVAVQMTRLLNPDKLATHHKIASQGYLADYLVTNVLESQPSELREFLIETSILQSFNAELANAVCGHDKSQQFIHQLDSLQALVVPLDDELEWFRYHHLFSECVRDFLKQEDPEKFMVLHRRAAKWCGENRLIAEAVNYANAIKDYDLSTQIINDNCEWMRAEQFGGDGYFNYLLTNIPEKKIFEDPRILYSKTYACILDGNFKKALEYYNAAEALLEKTDVTPGVVRDRLTISTALLCAVEFEFASEGGWLANRLNTIEELKSKSPKMDSKLHRICALVRQALAIQSVCYGNFDEARSHAVAAEVEIQNVYTPVMEVYLQANFGIIEFWNNDWEKARRHFQNSIKSASQSSDDHCNMQSIGATLLFSLDYWEGTSDYVMPPDFEEALFRIVQADGWYDVYSIGFDAIIHHALACKEYAKADTLISALEQSTERLAIKRLTLFAEVLRLDLFTASNDLGQAELAFSKVNKWFSIDRSKMEDHGWFNWIAASYACARYLKAIGKLGAASRYVEAGLEVANFLDVVVSKVRGVVLCAAILESTGERDKALTMLQQAIEDTANVNLPKAFLGEVSDGLLNEAVSTIMAQTPTYVAKDIAARLVNNGAQNMFSAREEEVLQCISQGKSNKEIARELDVTDNTIKFHLRNIYRKLGVKKRVPAVEKAREIGIL